MTTGIVFYLGVGLLFSLSYDLSDRFAFSLTFIGRFLRAALITTFWPVVIAFAVQKPR